MNTSKKTISRIIAAIHGQEGEGFDVRRPFPSPYIEDVDPFLLLDEMGPMDTAPGQAKGAPDHPHRGFETVTYMLSGAMEHEDSQGNKGRIGPGDVQWMTAGAGVIHSELPAPELLRDGGRMHGIQLWVNLPRRDKMMAPRYQDLKANEIPQTRSEDGKAQVRVIAGESMGQQAHIDTRIPITYLHFTLKPGASIEQKIPIGQRSFAYILQGEGQFAEDPQLIGSGKLVLFSDHGDSITFSNPVDANQDLDLILLGGQPLNESIARYGPFVMNTPDEIYQAIKDFRSGHFGEIQR